MGILKFFKKDKQEDLEAKRREHLLTNGRITDGTIIDAEATENGEIVYYSYNVHGADYESSEIIGQDRLIDPLRYAPGAKVGIRYDPKQHANSIIV